MPLGVNLAKRGAKKRNNLALDRTYIYLTYKLTTCLSDDSKNRSTKAMCKHNSMWLRMLPPLSRLCCAVTFKATARLGYTVHSSACKMWPLQVMQSNPSALRSTRQRSASSVKCLFCFLLHILSNVSVKAIMLMDPLADSTGETNPTTATTLHQSTRQNPSERIAVYDVYVHGAWSKGTEVSQSVWYPRIPTPKSRPSGAETHVLFRVRAVQHLNV